MKLAACVEFIHTATLLHDDVVDESVLRRGLASANAVFGNQASVLVGDFLFARAFQLMVEDGSLVVLAILSRAAATIAEGEVLQLVTQNDLSTSEERYLEVIRGKTAALFSAACEVGAVVAERPAGEAAALAAFGMNLGVAFQLVDDALDYARGPGGAGQDRRRRFPRGQDHAAGAGGLSGRERGGSRFLAAHHRGERAERGDLDRALGLMERCGAIRATLERAHGFAAAAKTALGVFPDNALRRALMDVADYTVSRVR